jgi:hypothetical protein
MTRIPMPRVLSAVFVVGLLSVTGGCFFPGGGGGGGGGCMSATNVTLGTPFTVCLPEASSRVTVTVTGLNADTPVNVNCAVTDTDLLVKTANADNFSCASWATNDAATRTIPTSDPTVTFGVNSFPTGNPPGAATITITASS